MHLLIVSNRLPFTAVQEDGDLTFRESVGGLVSGLSSYLDSLKDAPFTRDEYIWIGWPGLSVAAERQDTLKLLAELAADPANQVVIVSGRERRTLATWLGGLDLTLIAEHGAWVKKRGQPWVARVMPADSWKQALRPLLESYVDHVPGSLIEEKEFCLVWHYRKVEPKFGEQQAQLLTRELALALAPWGLEVLQGNKVVEVRSPAFNKGVAAAELLAGDQFEFILALGDDWTDEDLFAALPESAYTVKVDLAPTQARFYVPTQAEVLPLLRRRSSQPLQRTRAC